jgi:uncharacterized alpha-E superfamily protein
MLSRTADHLYWMSRYTERAENLARMLDAHYRLSLLPRPAEAVRQGWEATLVSLGAFEAYSQQFERIRPEHALRFLSIDRTNPGSILSCLRAARENARAVRGTITSEMWENLNSAWLDARDLDTSRIENNFGEFVEWVKDRSHLIRGVTVGTMLRDEAFHFTRIGLFLERADDTTRILEARWRDPGRRGERVATESSEWAVTLRAMSAFEVYRKVYRDNVAPMQVTELLLLNEQMPRSVHRCLTDLYTNLCAVRNAGSGETERRAGELHAVFRFGKSTNSAPRACQCSSTASSVASRNSPTASPRISWSPGPEHDTAHPSRNALHVR